MADFPVQALIPIGVILAALIAGFFSVLNLIISKEQKVSEFRQQWIDSLRQELADHMAATVSLASMRELQKKSDEDFIKATSELQQRVTATYTSIKLRINPDDTDKKIKNLNLEVLRLIDRGRTLYNESKWKEARVNCNEITNASIPMLKEEWKRVKMGEKVYVWSKYVAIGILVISLAALIYAAILFWPSNDKLAPVAECTTPNKITEPANGEQPQQSQAQRYAIKTCKKY
jgi:hypothetical protein